MGWPPARSHTLSAPKYKIFWREGSKPGEGNVPIAAGNFIKTVTSNGVDTHYYNNGYLTVQPKGYSTWYTYGTGNPIPEVSISVIPIEAPPDYAGNTLSTARDLGKLGFNGEISYSLGVRDFVGDLDKYDYYRFNFNQTNSFKLRLQDLSADAKVELIQDRNNNGQVDFGEVLETSAGGTASQFINRTPLEKGIYYVRVSSNKAWADTNYSLDLTATPIPDKAGNTLDKAFNLGNLTFRQTTQQDFLHTNDRDDYYRFDLTTARQVDFAFDNSRAIMGLFVIQDKNNNNKIEGEEVSEIGSINMMAGSFSMTLEPGTYYALAQFPSDIDAYTSYELKIGTNPPDYAVNDFFKAREIPIDSKPKFFTDFVGKPDAQDFYHFKLNEKRKFESLLYGLTGAANIELVQDSNNNGRFDASDLKIVSSSGSSEQKIKASLDPGDYYIRISPQQTNNSTYYNLDFSALRGPVAVLDSDTQPVPQYETDIDKEYQNFSGLLGNPTVGYVPATPSKNGTTGYWKGFDNGTIHWTPQYGAVALWHDFQNVYNQTDGSGGWLGFPTKDKFDWEGGQRIDFEGGYIFYTSSKGAKAYRPWESPWQEVSSPGSGNSGGGSPTDGMIPYEFGHLGPLDNSLWEIAQRTLGDGSRWRYEIFKPDGSNYTDEEARRIPAGTIVYLPEYANVDGNSNNGNSGGGSQSPVQGKIPYVFGHLGRLDDTLSEIAQLTLGDASRWRYEIFKSDGSNYTDEEARRIPAGTIVYLPEYANVSGNLGGGIPGGGNNSGLSGSLVAGSGTYPGLVLETVTTAWGNKNIAVGAVNAGKNVNAVLAAIRSFENGGQYGSNGGYTPGDTGASTSIGAYQESYSSTYLPIGNSVMGTNLTLDQFYQGDPLAQDVTAIGRLQSYGLLDLINNSNLYDDQQRWNIAEGVVNAWGSWYSDRDQVHSTPEQKYAYKLAHSQAILAALKFAEGSVSGSNPGGGTPGGGNPGSGSIGGGFVTIDATPIDPDNKPSPYYATDLGTLNGSFIRSGDIGYTYDYGKDEKDYYRFYVGEDNTRVNLSLERLSGQTWDAGLELLYENGSRLDSSVYAIGRTLNKGTYYVGVSSIGAKTDYKLRLVELAGDIKDQGLTVETWTNDTPFVNKTVNWWVHKDKNVDLPDKTFFNGVNLYSYNSSGKTYYEGIEPNKPTIISIHGRGDSSNVGSKIDALSKVAASKYESLGYQVLALDWSEPAKDETDPPFNAARRITPVADWAVNTLNNLGIASKQITLFGHSLGSYVSAEIGRIFGGVKNLVALDPAYPGTNYDVDGNTTGFQEVWKFKDVADRSLAFVVKDAPTHIGGTAGDGHTADQADDSLVIKYDGWDPLDPFARATEEHNTVIDVFRDALFKGYLKLEDNLALPSDLIDNMYGDSGDWAYFATHEGRVTATRDGKIKELAYVNGQLGNVFGLGLKQEKKTWNWG